MVQEKWIPKVECIIPRTKEALENALDMRICIVGTELRWNSEALRVMKYVATSEEIKRKTEKVERLREHHVFLSELKEEVEELTECEEEEEWD
ncbi:hypothetical protein ES703_69743 [subsurface metagenome]